MVILIIELHTCFKKDGDFTINKRFVIRNDLYDCNLYDIGTTVMMKIDQIFTTYLSGRQSCHDRIRNLTLADDFAVI